MTGPAVPGHTHTRPTRQTTITSNTTLRSRSLSIHTNQSALASRPQIRQSPLLATREYSVSHALFLARVSLAVRHVVDLYLIVTTAMAAPQRGQPGIPNHTNGREDTRTHEIKSLDLVRVHATGTNTRLARNYAQVAKRTEQPEISGELLGHHQPLTQHQQNPRSRHAYYESFSPHPANKQLFAAACHPFEEASYPSSFNYPSIMSLAYENRTFSDYPQSSIMHDPNEHEENNMQHHRYPSPPPPLSENPYNPQLDAAGLEMQMPELPQKEESDAPSPGRSKAIPKPDREVTKGEDGRFVCTWAGCTEDVKSFNRKCEWSKVGFHILFWRKQLS